MVAVCSWPRCWRGGACGLTLRGRHSSRARPMKELSRHGQRRATLVRLHGRGRRVRSSTGPRRGRSGTRRLPTPAVRNQEDRGGTLHPSGCVARDRLKGGGTRGHRVLRCLARLPVLAVKGPGATGKVLRAGRDRHGRGRPSALLPCPAEECLRCFVEDWVDHLETPWGWSMTLLQGLPP